MKPIPIICVIILATVLTLGCVEPPDEGNGDGAGNGTTYTSFTNSEFYVEYPSDWNVFIEDTSIAGITTEAFLGAEDEKGTGLYILGHKTPSTLHDFDESYESLLENLQNSEDATVLDYEMSVNEAFIEYTSIKGGAVNVYSKTKFLGCIESFYSCTSSVENIYRSEYQDEINHIISSFTCNN